MYKAIFDQVTTYNDAPDQLKPFIQFDANRRGIEIKDNDRFALLRIDTSMSYLSIPLDHNITVDSIEKQLGELETVLDGAAKEKLIELLNDQ